MTVLSSHFERPLPVISWHDAVHHCHSRGVAHTLVTVLGISGSSPRGVGTKMVVTDQQQMGTIGGGALERLVCERARKLMTELASRDDDSSGLPGDDGAFHRMELAHFPLGQAAAQCCGGAVTILLEAWQPVLAPLAVFGAGHVAQALITLLSELERPVLWIDSREELLKRTLPDHIRAEAVTDPLQRVNDLPKGCDALVLTHDHALDFELVKALLARDDVAFVGLIGSQTKAARFRQRLLYADVEASHLERLCCPVGLQAVPTKAPMAVAVSIVAQLLTLSSEEATSDGPAVAEHLGLNWRDVKQLRKLFADSAL